MAAHHSINPEQLKLFMSADELQSHLNFSYEAKSNGLGVGRSTPKAMKALWASKLAESKVSRPESGEWVGHGAGVYDSIAKEGVTQHIRIDQGITDPSIRFVGNGHHRVAAAAGFQKDSGKDVFVPVEYGGAGETFQSYDKRYPQNVRKDWTG